MVDAVGGTGRTGGTGGTDGLGEIGEIGGAGPGDGDGGSGAALVLIRDVDGRPRGSGFVADDRGTVVTGREVVEGLTRMSLHAPGPAGRSWTAGPGDVTVVPGAALALVRTDGLGVRPLPVAAREVIAPGTYVRLAARGWRQARVLFHVRPEAVELALGTDGRDALRLGGEPRGGPVLDAETGAVLAVLTGAPETERCSGSSAVALWAAAGTDPGGPLAALLERNAVTVPCFGADLNLAGVLELTAATVASAFPPPGPGPGSGVRPVERPEIAAELAAFTRGDRPVLALVGEAGTGRTTALAALAARRAHAPAPAPTLWLRGADLRDGDGSVGEAVTRALAAAARTAATTVTTAGAGTETGAGAGAGAGAGPGRGPGSGGGGGLAGRAAGVAAGAGRALLVVLDAPEEMEPGLARRLGPWTEATVRWLRGAGARMAVATGPAYWERAGARYPSGALYVPARPARRLPPALPVGDLTPAEAEALRTRLGLPADAVQEADARHPLTLTLRAGLPAAGAVPGRAGRDEVFAAHLDLLCLRTAARITAEGAGGSAVPGPGVRSLAARVAGRVHEAARRCLDAGEGQLDRAAFEELFPRHTGWARAVLAEGLLTPAGPGHRFAHEELSDWIQAAHLDVLAVLDHLVHQAPPAPVPAPVPPGPGSPAGPVPSLPPHRIGPVREALRRLPPDMLRRELLRLVHALDVLAVTGDPAVPGDGRAAPAHSPPVPPAGAAAAPGTAGRPGDTPPSPGWWAVRLLRETLLHAPDAQPHLPVLRALAGHVARTGPGGFGGWFWNRLRLPEPDRLDLLRALLPADPAEAAPGDRFLDAVARRLVRDPRLTQPLLCAWFTDERRLRGRPGASVATAAQALLHTHRLLAVDSLTEALVTAAHPRADELLAVLAEEEPAALCRAVHRWAHDERPGRRAAAARHGPAVAPYALDPADRELLRHAARALLVARPADSSLHGAALGMLLRDPQTRGRYLPAALSCFRDQGCASRLSAEALVAVVPVLPDPEPVFAALWDRADGEVVRALAALTDPGLAGRAAGLVREHLARCPEDAPHAAAFVDRRLRQGPAAHAGLLPLVLEQLRSGPVVVRAALAAVLAAPGGDAPYAPYAPHGPREELAGVLLREETSPQVLDAFLGAVAAGARGRPEARTRELLRCTGRQLLRVTGGPAVFERRTVELARADPAFGALAARWLAEADAREAALLGPGARRAVESLGGAARGTV